MRVIRGLHNLGDTDRGVAVTLGNFDGVHRGHQALLSQLRQQAPGLPACVVLFEPQPLEFLRPQQAPPRLQNLAEKLRCLRRLGLEQVLVLRFDQLLARMPARQFVQQVLIDGLAAKHLLVGDDWRFGYRRSGDFQLLQQLAETGAFALAQLDTVALAHERVSSTRIRDALASGDVSAAAQCLGRSFSLRGRVIHGQKLGRKLGAPTANIALRHASPLRHGVYCVRLNQQAAVANIGLRPTVEGSRGEHLEVHLLDGVHHLYDQFVEVEFERFLRPEQAFANLEELKLAIAADVSQAREYFQQDTV